MENEDRPKTPEKQDGSTYLQSTKEVNENQMKRTTSYHGSAAAKRSNDAWEKEDHQPKAPEKRESAPSYQKNARKVSVKMV